MIQITQTVFGDGKDGTECGNCFATCIACILERPLEEIPNFVHLYGDNFFREANKWLKNEGYPCVLFPVHPQNAEESGLTYIATGPAGRGFMHCCIYRNGELIWDPHPDKSGIKSVTNAEILALNV